MTTHQPTASPPDALRASNSVIMDWRECEQRYWYRYVDGLRPRVEDAAPHLGRVLHDYLAGFYSLCKAKANRVARTSPKAAHAQAFEATAGTFAPEIEQLVHLASGLSQSDLARDLAAILPLAKVLADAYYRTHGRHDAERYEVLLCERAFEVPVKDGVVLPGRIDLVTRDRSDGSVALWEHKTTRRVPRHVRRLADVQTLLYNVALNMEGFRPDRVVWNYIHTMPPTDPRILKDGTISRDRNQCTTAELYVAALREHAATLKAQGLSADDYRDAIHQVEDREREVMFPRHEMPVIQREEVVLRDYVRTVEDIERARSDSAFVPVRNIGQRCEWCPFLKLCLAVLTGGDEASVQRKQYDVKKGDGDGRTTASAREEDDLLALID